MQIIRIFRGPLGLLFIAHIIASWGDRMWWFAGGIFMKDLAGFSYHSLLFVGIYTFMVSGTVLTFGAVLGRWIDNTPRLRAVQIILILQNSLLIFSCITVVVMFKEWDFIVKTWNGILLRTLQAFVIVTASFSQLASTGTQIIIQKDWIIVICDGDMDLLATFNSILRTIDLTAQVLAPLTVSLVISHGSSLYTAGMIGIWNLLSMIVEYYIFYKIYTKIPKLREQKRKMQHIDSCSEKYAEHDVCPTDEKRKICCDCFYAFFYDWKFYFSHTVRFAGFGLALLYMTVLGFDSITTAFGDTQISTDVVAACQGAAAVMGVLGSISFPQIRKSIQQESIALIGLSLEVISLVLCVVSVWAPGSPFDANSLSTFSDPFEDTGEAILDPEAETKVVGDPTAMICLFAGIIVSRYGLWLTDITITQVMQERIEENKRGAVNGVQDSLNMAMDMIKSVLVVVFPRPEQFGLLIILSFCSVCSGLISYGIFHCQIQRLLKVSKVEESTTSQQAIAAN
ncbi:hypothetical protein R5R35_004426 [Gryllus longicercus]|uniref:Solute carrier family 40 member n=1 Tax=Gryllus longicercus TaxID=2509291 RepID=A0AAN9VAK4_9ORTH